MKKILCYCAMGLLLATKSFGQDPHFSQFFASPLTLNPALTGKFDGVVRVAGNYRNQWPAISKAFITSTVSVDAPILSGKLPYTDTWGVGLMAMTDRTADGILNSNFLAISTSYHKGLDEDGLHQIGIGFQGAYSNKRLDATRLHFENQLDLDGNWSNPSGESFANTKLNVNYFDFNAGFLYSGSTTGYNNFYAGLSVYHINRPKESFTNGYYVLDPRVTFHAGGYFPIADNAVLHVSGLHSRQAGAYETVIGGAVAINATGDEEHPTNFYVGSWYRFHDATIPYVGFEFSDFRLGATYDVNTSSLKTASQSRGGIEISLIYIKQASDGKKNIPCPKF